jgi:hypothetical protein
MPDTVHPEIIELARQIAAEHKLEPALVCAVIEQEVRLESVGRAL